MVSGFIPELKINKSTRVHPWVPLQGRARSCGNALCRGPTQRPHGGCPLAESTGRVEAALAMPAAHAPGAGCVSSRPQLTSFPSCVLHFHRPYPSLSSEMPPDTLLHAPPWLRGLSGCSEPQARATASGSALSVSLCESLPGCRKPPCAKKSCKLARSERAEASSLPDGWFA